jgi:hypothetical protein
MDDVHYEGFLTKKGGFTRRNWKKRYFVLKEGVLCYFDSPSDVERVRGNEILIMRRVYFWENLVSDVVADLIEEKKMDSRYEYNFGLLSLN